MTGTWFRECPGYLVLFYCYQKCYNYIQQKQWMNKNLNAALSGGIAGRSKFIATLTAWMSGPTVRSPDSGPI